MDAELDEIVAANRHSAVTAPVSIDSWSIPEFDRSALHRWGLPVMNENPKSVHFKADFQSGTSPSLKRDDIIAYRIGSYHYRDIGIRAGDSLVIGYPQDDRYPRLSFINGMAAAFVNIIWRWKAAFKVLCEIEDNEEFEQLEANLTSFYEYVRRTDSAISDDDQFDWWLGILQGWLFPHDVRVPPKLLTCFTDPL